VQTNELTLDPSSPCSTTPASSPRNLADWATASTLVSMSDCVEPTSEPTTIETKQSGSKTPCLETDLLTGDDHNQSKDAPAQLVAQTTSEPSLERQLAEQLAAVHAENKQLRAQLENIHANLTSQVKMTRDATACLTPPVGEKMPHKSSHKSDHWLRHCVWKSRQQLSDATSMFFATPETNLGWLTRSTVAFAGVYILGRYGRDPALQVAHSAKEMFSTAGSTMCDKLSAVKLTTSDSSKVPPVSLC